MLTQSSASSPNLILVSQAFLDGSILPTQHTCKGQNTSPPLNITGVPSNAKSLALIMHDPDAVSGDFTHWLIWNIPVSTQTIAANGLPIGAVQGQNGSGQNQYTGPCPPAGTGTHRYMFELYALDNTLGLEPGANRDQLQRAINGHIVGQHTLTGLFGTT